MEPPPLPMGSADGGCLHRFQDILSSQLGSLHAALAAVFERELALAAAEAAAEAAEAAEAERSLRCVAEVELRRLRLEVGTLRAEAGERRQASPSPSPSPSPPVPSPPWASLAFEEEDVGELPSLAPSPSPAATDSAEEPEEGLGAALPSGGPPANSVIQIRKPLPIPMKARPNNLLAESMPSLSPMGSPPLMPSRIPKPSRGAASAAAGPPGPKASDAAYTLEDLDDQRFLRLAQGGGRPASGCASPNPGYGPDDRSPTPRGPRARARRAAAGGAAGGRDRDGAEEEGPPGRFGHLRGPQGAVMQDKRTLRKLHRDAFLASIHEWREQHAAPAQPCGRARRCQACQVFVRMRPMFDKERQRGEFESVSTFQEWGEVVVHNCLFHADLVRMFVHHFGFCFPRTFGGEARNEDVYSECGSPLVAHALGGQLSTLFMFGPTGSGKTYTINAIIEQAAQDIFDAPGWEADDEPRMKLRAFEIAGKKCFDLLVRQRTELRLLDGDEGRTNIVGAVESPIGSTEDCLRALREAFARRATASHGRNEESSRSHCVCILEVPRLRGSLVLVDCAGTERRQDTDQHSTERTKESAEINTSLHALKECIRYRAKEQRQAKDRDDDKQRQVHVPYRGSYLTRVLHESFTRPGSRLAAIGTISPAATDVEHTLSTLRTLQMLLTDGGGVEQTNFEQKVDVDARTNSWSARARRNGAVDGEPRASLPPSGSHADLKPPGGFEPRASLKK